MFYTFTLVIIINALNCKRWASGPLSPAEGEDALKTGPVLSPLDYNWGSIAVLPSARHVLSTNLSLKGLSGIVTVLNTGRRGSWWYSNLKRWIIWGGKTKQQQQNDMSLLAGTWSWTWSTERGRVHQYDGVFFESESPGTNRRPCCMKYVFLDVQWDRLVTLPPTFARRTEISSSAIRRPITIDQYTVNSLLTDTLVSGQLYLRTLFSITVFTSQSNSVFTRSRKRTLVSGRGHFWKWNLDFFHCLRSLVSGHSTFSLL